MAAPGIAQIYRIWTGVMAAVRVVRRPQTLGVRAIVLDDRDRVLLVRHTYVNGWYLPGGGVKRRETPAESALRELREETAVIATAPPQLLGAYGSFRRQHSDYVLVYVVRDWRRETWRPNLEIAECAFFPLDGLPEGVSPATVRRLEELCGRAAPADLW